MRKYIKSMEHSKTQISDDTFRKFYSKVHSEFHRPITNVIFQEARFRISVAIQKEAMLPVNSYLNKSTNRTYVLVLTTRAQL